MLMDLCPPTFASDVCKVQIAIRNGSYSSLIIIDVYGLQTDTKWKFDQNNCPRLHLHLISSLLRSFLKLLIPSNARISIQFINSEI